MPHTFRLFYDSADSVNWLRFDTVAERLGWLALEEAVIGCHPPGLHHLTL